MRQRPSRGLSQQRPAALQAELATREDVALAAIVHALTLPVYPYGANSCLELRTTAPRLGSATESAAARDPGSRTRALG